MTQPYGDGPVGSVAAMDYRQQAREFLDQSREYLADGNLHHASEKGWGAAAWMAKAVAVTQGWQYDRHDHFQVVLNNARSMTGNDRFRQLSSVAHSLHRNSYVRRIFLDADVVGLDLGEIEELLDILELLADAA